MRPGSTGGKMNSASSPSALKKPSSTAAVSGKYEGERTSETVTRMACPARPGRSHEDETQAEPHTHAEVEAHPRDLGPPFAPPVRDPSALECVSQAFAHREITDTAGLSVSPARKVHGNVHRQHQI